MVIDEKAGKIHHRRAKRSFCCKGFDGAVLRLRPDGRTFQKISKVGGGIKNAGERCQVAPYGLSAPLLQRDISQRRRVAGCHRAAQLAPLRSSATKSEKSAASAF